MSGDCFDGVYYKVEYDCLDKLKEYMINGLVNWDFDNLDNYKFMLHNIFEGFYKISEANIWMKRLDYFLGCDDGEKTFQELMDEELEELFKNKKKDKRCFDCFRMGNSGCTLLNNYGKTITLLDFICPSFIPIDWAKYKITEDKVSFSKALGIIPDGRQQKADDV
jgi:hypothetical protein